VAAPPPGARVLDFGCGEGTMLDGLQHCGWQTFGIEPALDRAFARHGRLFTIPATPTFDLVLALHVLEHVPSPLALLRQLAGACRIGGYLLVAVPRFDTLPTHRDYRYVLNGRAHIMAYTWPCLRGLLARAGWDAIALPVDNRLTPSRMRVLARRTDDPPAETRVPAAVARAAIAGYYAGGDSRPLAARLGLIRLVARRMDVERRRAKAERKATALTRHVKDR
jgi:SAM-dependent methyltransferase